jgi:hypothetical protein
MRDRAVRMTALSSAINTLISGCAFSADAVIA